jgi:hypothetical protein
MQVPAAENTPFRSGGSHRRKIEVTWEAGRLVRPDQRLDDFADTVGQHLGRFGRGPILLRLC